LEEEKKLKIEEEKRKKVEKELKRVKEEEEIEREMEQLRLRRVEEEKQRIEIERMAYAEQEENDRKAFFEQTEDPTLVIESQPVIEEAEKIYREDFLPSQILPMNFEILVNQALNNELNLGPNIPLQLEQLKLEEVVKDDNDDEIENKVTQILDLPEVQKELFEEWHKHNCINFFENIKQEYELKIKKNEEQKRIRPRSSKVKRTQNNIPESLLLKKSNKSSLDEINFLYFQALTGYSLNTLELCTNLSALVLTNSQITVLDGLNNCANLKYLNVQVRFDSLQFLK
jgi:hypothetical protein